ncbi:MAG: glycosyltransferase family 87 protein [Candidatus Sulfotelmatobacter sp.]
MSHSEKIPKTQLTGWITERRLRAHAVILALCLWGVCAVDFATPGFFDRARNIKFQDFLQFPIAARLILEGRAQDLYNDQVLADHIRAIVGHDTHVFLRYFYGPQVALPFVPLARLPFLAEAVIWVALSLLMYFVCIHLLWKSCPALRRHRRLVAICATAYPPLFHFFVRGQISVPILVGFTLALIAFQKDRPWLGGIALGFLVFKPQFLVAMPLVLLLARSWKAFFGLVISAAVQLAFALLYFGSGVMRSYLATLLHSAGQPATTELLLSPIQMHSLRSFFVLLIPWPPAVFLAYLVSAIAVIALATAIWKSSSPLAIRFSALILAAVLVNPHIYIYDLLALAPALLLLADFAVENFHDPSVARLGPLLYLAFLLPLFGPLAKWTHLQLSVPIFAALLWLLFRISRQATKTPGHELASTESVVV